LNAVVRAVGDITRPARSVAITVRPAELSGRAAARAPRRDERAVLVELRDRALTRPSATSRLPSGSQAMSCGRPKCVASLPATCGLTEGAHQLLASLVNS